MKVPYSVARIIVMGLFLPWLAGMQPVTADNLAPHSTIQVTTELDEYNTTGSGSGCALREAVESANTDMAFGGCVIVGSGTDTITFLDLPNPIQLSISGPYEVNNARGDLNISTNMTIQGNGMDTTIIDASYQTTGSRIFSINNADQDLSVTIHGLTVTNGNSRAEGAGAISNGETLLLEDVAILNSTTELNGGGLWTSPANGGTTTLRRCLIENNTAGLKGGGIYASDALIIENSILYNNHTLDEADGMGAGLYSLTPLTITHTIFEDNSSMNDGGNLYLYFNGGAATIEDSTFTGGNSEYGDGGNTFIKRSPSNQPFITIRRTEISDGTAGYGMGGGIYNLTGIALENVTISGNHAETGGGIYVAEDSWSSTYKNINISNNTQEGDNTYGHGLYNATASVMNIYNSIVALNGLPDTCGGHYCDCYTTVQISSGNNLERGDSCGFGQATDRQHTNPLMGPLSHNWGSNRTHALYFDSPAVDHGNNATCLADDQRGRYRPVDGDAIVGAVCDIGAYEYGHQLGFLSLILK